MIKYLKIYLFIFVLIKFISCVEDEHKKIYIEAPDHSYKEEFFVDKDSMKDGEYKRFFANGQLEISCIYKKGSLEGIKKRYSDKGYLEALETYKNSMMNGSYFVFYPNGKIKLKQIFIDNLLQGISYGYYSDGKLREKVEIKNGFENGSFEEYYPSGRLHWKGTYLNGEYEHDSLFEYNQSGDLMRKLFCQMGFCFTVWRLRESDVK